MTNRTRLAVAILSVAVSSRAVAESYDATTMAELAVENDDRRRILEIDLENERLTAKRNALTTPLSLSVGTKEKGLVVSRELDGSSTSISIDPSVTVTLPEPYLTGISLAAPLSLVFEGGETSFSATPRVSATQPLNEILGLEPSERADELTVLYRIEHARLELIAREQAVRKNVYSALREIVELGLTVRERERAYADARESLEQASALDTYSPESSDFKRLELLAGRAEQSFRKAERQYRQSLSSLGELTGEPVESVPASFEAALPPMPGEEDHDLNSAVYLAEIVLETRRTELERLTAPHIPEYSTGASYDIARASSEGGHLHTVGASFRAAFEHFTVSAGLSGSYPDGALSGMVSLSWRRPDERSETITIDIRRNDVESARLSLDSAMDSYRSTIENLAERKTEIEVRRSHLEEDLELAELVLEERRNRFEAGIIGRKEVEDAEWEIERIDYRTRILELDEMLLVVDMESATSVDL